MDHRSTYTVQQQLGQSRMINIQLVAWFSPFFPSSLALFITHHSLPISSISHLPLDFAVCASPTFLTHEPLTPCTAPPVRNAFFMKPRNARNDLWIFDSRIGGNKYNIFYVDYMGKQAEHRCRGHVARIPYTETHPRRSCVENDQPWRVRGLRVPE